MSDRDDSGTAGEGAGRPPSTPEEFPQPFPTQRRLRRESPGTADEVLGRAARTVEELLAAIKASQEEIARLDLSQPDLEEQLTQSRSAEEIVGEVLLTAHRAADGLLEKARQDAASVIADARRETLPVLAEAQRTLEEAGRLQRDAQAMFAQARLHAGALVESARAERERLIADTLADAEQRRRELERDNVQLETAIKRIRSEWAERAAQALARLDGIALEAGPPPQEQLDSIDARASREEINSGADESESPLGGEVVRDLHARLPGSEAAEPSPTDHVS